MNNDYSKNSDKEIIEMFNSEVRNNWWVSTRALHLDWIRREFINRWFDFSAIGDNNSMTYMNKIKLIVINWIKTIVIDKDDYETMPFHLEQISKNIKLTDLELIDRYNSLVKQSWHRNVVIVKDMLRQEIINRWFDFSELWLERIFSINRDYTPVSEENNFSFNNKVKLINKNWIKFMKIVKDFRLFFIRQWVYWWDIAWYWIYLINNTNESYDIDYNTGWYFSEWDECYKLEEKKKELKLWKESNVLIEEWDLWALDFVWFVNLELKWYTNYKIDFNIWKWAPSWELKDIDWFDSKGIEMNFTIKNI